MFIFVIILSFYCDERDREKTSIGIRIGIRREDKNRWERRAPLTPGHVQILKKKYGIDTAVQPSGIRVFSDHAYRDAGAEILEDLSGCPAVFGIKEMPASFFRPGTAYVFFSHTIKGQKSNMPMLKQLMAMGCHLVDYEKVMDRNGRRALFFGRYAGIAGMMETLSALGNRLALEGVPNPFSAIKPAHQYGSLDGIREAVSAAGELMRRDGLHPSLLPLVFGFAGYGHVSQGAQEVLDLLPFTEISPEKLLQDRFSLDRSDTVYKVVFSEWHMAKPEGPGKTFELMDYYAHPESYVSVFDVYLPYLTVLVNTIYWTPRYPRLVSCQNLKRLFESGPRPSLRIIGDITCDIEGSIECTRNVTTPDDPVFLYDPVRDTLTAGIEGNGVIVMAVDNLPCELPAESSQQFGSRLLPFVPEIARADYSLPFEKIRLSKGLKNAMIVHAGRLTPDFEYLNEHL